MQYNMRLAFLVSLVNTAFCPMHIWIFKKFPLYIFQKHHACKPLYPVRLHLLKMFLLLLLVSLQTNHSSFAQARPFPIDKWVRTLSAETDPYNNNFWTFTVAVRSM